MSGTVASWLGGLLGGAGLPTRGLLDDPTMRNPVGWSSIYPAQIMSNASPSFRPLSDAKLPGAERPLFADEVEGARKYSLRLFEDASNAAGLMGSAGTKGPVMLASARKSGLPLPPYPAGRGMTVAGAVNPVQTMGGLLGQGAMKRYPVEVAVDPRRAGTVDVLPGGRVVFYAPRGGDFPLDQSIRDTIRKQVESAVQPASDGTFYRLTNNKHEVALAKSGQLRPSRNYVDNIEEPGLSVADGLHYAGQGYKYGYRVKGDVVGKGSDGEPVLNPKAIDVLSKIMTIDELVKFRSQASVPALEKALQSKGWTLDQWNDFNRGFLSRSDK